MKIKLKYLVFIAYVALVASLFVVSLTMARYVSNIGTEGSFEIGDQLYFNYERSVLYRGDQLIVGKEVYDAEFGGTIIETMNVAPGDNITYHFYISNFELKNNEVVTFNDVAADFHPASKALLRLPIKGFIYDADSTIYYRKVYEKEYPTSGILDNDPLMEYDSDASFSFLTADKKLDLPETRESLIVYEFTVTVALDGQIPGTTSHDYFDATLSIDLFFNAVSKE